MAKNKKKEERKFGAIKDVGIALFLGGILFAQMGVAAVGAVIWGLATIIDLAKRHKWTY